MEDRISGYLELEHTADWQLAVWAPDFVMLLVEAARGMYALSGTRLETKQSESRILEISAQEREVLLVMFLEELLYLGEMEGLAFDKFELKLNNGILSAQLVGGDLISQEKEIKAVTYHNLNIKETERGLEANIVFDV